MSFGKRAWRALALTSVLLTPFAAPVAASAADHRVQLVCDEKTVAPGGTASFHILYHNVSNKDVSHVQFHIHVSEGVVVEQDATDGMTWDEANHLLLISLDHMAKGEARVIPFRLHVKDDVKEGTSCVVTLDETDDDGTDAADQTNVALTIGTETHQPFFFGYPDGQFHPHAMITRAEVATVTAKLMGLSTPSVTVAPFRDVPSSHWAASHIESVAADGYMSGYADGSFHPDTPITRAELASLLLKIRGVEALPLQGFQDTDHHWANDAIATAKALQLISGIGNNRFAPDAPTERQAAAVIFDVAFSRGPLTDGTILVVQHFPDVPRSSWSFPWIEEAAKVAHQSVHVKPGSETLLQYLSP